MKDKKRSSYFEGWRLYPGSMLGHHIQGVVAGVAIHAGDINDIAAGITLTVLYVVYQGYTRFRKGDSAGLDVADYIAGFAAGVAAHLVWRFFA